MRRVELIGWQSWSDSSRPSRAIPLNYVSPHGENETTIEVPRRRRRKPVSGWCSWYAFGKNIDHDTILTQAQWLADRKQDLPIEHILIDDGWCQWGDWLTPTTEKFPNLRETCISIQRLGFQVGLWFAPLLVEASSNLAKTNPEWLVRDYKGKLVEGRRNTVIDRFLPARRWILDLTKPEVQEYLLNVVDVMVNQWGISLLKADFLYAQHFNPAFTESNEPDQLLSQFLSTIKENFPQVYLVACGCPLKPAAGIVDAMRISEDIANPKLRGNRIINSIVHSRNLSQLEVNLQRRETTRQLWDIDPDVIVTHPSFGLTHDQILRLQALILQAKGLKFLGDDMTELSNKQIETYLLPLFA